eukprot:6742858-Prymnesium_polylepis.2
MWHGRVWSVSRRRSRRGRRAAPTPTSDPHVSSLVCDEAASAVWPLRAARFGISSNVQRMNFCKARVCRYELVQ